ncbi:hypothetical protein [Nocardia sp. BMG51109]|uniref:hypothetical protein n=1 Tax=Nocardia sp. BMG51109 TaxID=1056816 RepID=UPI0012EBAD85|nr:hypothetical protein [Nocardia sp. BMG51109]
MRTREYSDGPSPRSRHRRARFTVLFAAMATAFCTAVAPAADAAPSLTISPGMAIRTDDEQCSVGLTGRIGATSYAVTAGHCYEPGARVYAENGAPIGWFEAGVPDGDVDHLGFALVRLSGDVSTGASAGRLLITAVDGNPAVGQRVCKTGARTGTTCGVVTTVTGTHVLTTFLVDHGDSGGVVYTETGSGTAVFVGMVVGMGPDFALVEPAAYLTDLIRRRGPSGADQFRWQVTDNR